MTTFDKAMLAVLTLMTAFVTTIALTAMHYNHVEKMADKQIEMAKLEKICVDD